ncbi:hypothetical protein ACFL3U_02095 [Pseudomonadota bacterium]
MIPESVKYLMAAGHKAPSPDNSQPWRFLWDGECLSVRHRIKDSDAKIFGVGSHGLLLTMGAVIENLVQASNAAGLDVNWESSTEGDPYYIRTKVNPNFSIPDASWKHALFQRHTNRLPFKLEPLATALLEQLASIQQKDARLLVITDRKQIAEIENLVNTASQARFQTKEIHEYFASTLRFDSPAVNTGDGLDVETFGLPPGGRGLLKLINDWSRLSLLNKVGIYRLLSTLEAKGFGQGSAILAISGPADYDSVFAAGRVMERAWIMLNEVNVGVHPYYVVADQLQRLAAERVPAHLVDGIKTLATGTEKLLGPGTLHMLLRVGLPVKSPIKSQRVPLESVITEKSSAEEG